MTDVLVTPGLADDPVAEPTLGVVVPLPEVVALLAPVVGLAVPFELFEELLQDAAVTASAATATIIARARFTSPP